MSWSPVADPRQTLSVACAALLGLFALLHASCSESAGITHGAALAGGTSRGGDGGRGHTATSEGGAGGVAAGGSPSSSNNGGSANASSSASGGAGTDFGFDEPTNAWKVDDNWVATDALGRKLPRASEVTSSKANGLVGLFYWTWHTDQLADCPPYNTSQILASHPEALDDYNSPAWGQSCTYWWDEPLFGYYRTTDEWVLRKHAEMLADAGVDVVFFDCTNGSYTWKSSYTKLLEVWDQAQKDGVSVPKVAFVLSFSPNDDGRAALEELYQQLYKPGLYSGLWFRLQGKPLIIAYPDNLTAVQGDPVATALYSEILEFFTFRSGQPDYVNGPSRPDQWGWLEDFPQHEYGPKQGGGFEQMTVGVAQNATPQSNGHADAFDAAGSFGRGYTSTQGQDTTPDAYLYGANFQQQWDHAIAASPDLVWVTGWNEWYSGRYPNWGTRTLNAFVDEFSWDKSRDIEPTKAWGSKGDSYYLQLISNIRRFKGVAPAEAVSAQKTILIDGQIDDWNGVRPNYRAHVGSTLHRDSAGAGAGLHYTDTSGRNDLVLARVARDAAYLYFLVEAAEPLSPSSDAHWMRLFIDIDRDKKTGWEGYDYVVNRLSATDSAIVEHSDTGWNYTQIGTADYAVSGRFLELRIARRLLDSPTAPLDLEFKWVDNSQDDGNVLDFYVSGDAAPPGRFNYLFTEKP